MAEDKEKGSPDEAGGNDNKVFSLFCLGDRYIPMTLISTYPTILTAITVAYLWTKLFFSEYRTKVFKLLFSEIILSLIFYFIGIDLE